MRRVRHQHDPRIVGTECIIGARQQVADAVRFLGLAAFVGLQKVGGSLGSLRQLAGFFVSHKNSLILRYGSVQTLQLLLSSRGRVSVQRRKIFSMLPSVSAASRSNSSEAMV